MNVSLDIPASRAVLSAALEGLVGVNYILLRRQRMPRLYKAGVRYRAEQLVGGKRLEQWKTAPQVFALGLGDCEDLAAWRAAELRVHRGEPARAVVYRTGPKKFHAVVERADGSIEDPSKRLGMRRR